MKTSQEMFQICFVFLIITVRQNPYDHYIYDRYSYSTRQNSGDQSQWHGHN